MMWRRDDDTGWVSTLAVEERKERRRAFNREMQDLQKAEKQVVFMKKLALVSAIVVIAYLLASL